MPSPDPEFDKDLYQQRIEQMENEMLPKLEKQRLEFLDKNWQPNADWWGSEPAK
ncbi:hypothetical protein [Cyclobacterium qasimii]|uniref:Arylsulfatase n=2 Tax=Cyclobacterium qasimii TaxID=1350429 RepID=S7WND4_9BACT|nr:hypothetical protein [Cyclobacterium qasimii]EPR68219.1 Arylsulfatase [Cyclobacterium qasimii M12-11B]